MGGLFPAGPRARFLATLLSTVLSFASILSMLPASPLGLETGAAGGRKNQWVIQDGRNKMKK